MTLSGERRKVHTQVESADELFRKKNPKNRLTIDEKAFSGLDDTDLCVISPYFRKSTSDTPALCSVIHLVRGISFVVADARLSQQWNFFLMTRRGLIPPDLNVDDDEMPRFSRPNACFRLFLSHHFR